MASEQFSLCWDNFHKNMSSGMNSLLENEDLVDVTLAVEGKCLKAHKMVLSVCSPYFKELFKSNPCQHPIVFMKDVSYVAISDLLQFMYQGEVQVSQENLTTFIKTAEALQIKGLTGDGNGSADDAESVSDSRQSAPVEEYRPVPKPKKQPPPPVVTTTPAPKRPRLEAQSAPAIQTKQEPASSSDPPIQFKMEPYDNTASGSIHDDAGDDNFGDDTLDDNTVDDTEDYSMMEGGEEGEPQAGTSTDGAGEGQGMIYFRKGIKQDILVMDRYEYKIERKAPSSTYWCCIYKERLKCKARVVSLNKGDTLLLKYLIHNHAPTYFKPYSELIMKIVDIKYWPKRQSLTQGIICKEEKKERVKYEEEVIDTLNPVDEAKKVIEFLMKFDGYIHFREGLKYEIMVLDNYEYKRERQTTPSNMSWCCTYKEKYKCRARLVTNDDKVVIKSMSHNHIATFPNKNKQVELRAVKVHIEYKPSKERNRKKEEAENQSELVKFIISFENEDIEDNEGVKAIKQHEHSEDVVMIPDDDCEEAE